MIASSRTALRPRLEHEPAALDRAWRAKAREFGREVVLPLGQLVDRLVGDGELPRLPVREFLVQAREEGFTSLSGSSDRDSVGLSRAGEYMVLEELASADAGLTALLIAAPAPFHWARDAQPPCLREAARRFLRGECLDWSGCWTAGPRPSLRATPANGGWILAGRAESVLGAEIASHAALSCSIEIGGSGRVALAIVELDRPGITRRALSGQLGMRAQCRADLALVDVFVPGDELLFTAPPGRGSLTGAATLDQVIAAISAVGIARAAYRAAARFAREQQHAGVTVQQRRRADRLLPRLRSRLCHVRRSTAVAHLQRGIGGAPDEGGALEQATIARLLATKVALEVIGAAIELCDSWTNACGEVQFLDGSSCWLEKLGRDARSLSDLYAGSARGGPESVSPGLRSLEWTPSSLLASG